MYASRQHQPVGHDQPLSVLLDSYATYNRYDVIVRCFNVNIRLFFIPPHTSYGLAACDQFNNRIHQRRSCWETNCANTINLFTLTVTMRLEALVTTLKDHSTMYEVIHSAFRRADMGQNIHNVSLLANRLRDDVIVPAEVEIPTTTPSTLPTSAKTLCTTIGG